MNKYLTLGFVAAIALAPHCAKARLELPAGAHDEDLLGLFSGDTSLRTGLVIDAAGDILTAGHGLGACKKIYVGLGAPKSLTESRLIASDERTGLALVKGVSGRFADISESPASSGNDSPDKVEFVRSPAIIRISNQRVIALGDIVVSPYSGSFSPGVIWVSGEGFRGSDAGAPLFDKTTGQIVGIAIKAFPNPKFARLKTLSLSVGAPIMRLFWSDVVGSIVHKAPLRRIVLTEADVEQITGIVACVPK